MLDLKLDLGIKIHLLQNYANGGHKMILSETYTLHNGVQIPKLGLGTWLIDDDKVEQPIVEAIQMGYRHIDTAQAYGNEVGIGKGIKKSGINREELYIASKIAAEHKTYESATKSINETLDKLGLDYIDQMIIHSPQPWKEVNQSDNRYIEENRAVWKALEDAYRAGKVKVIGVSNFLIDDLKNLLETATIKPMINQILLHVSNTPLELVEYCQNNDIMVEAYSPIAHGVILNNPKIKEMADKYNVSVAQLCIRYTIQLGCVSLPKSANPEHMKSNSQVDFKINKEDMETLKYFEHIDNYGDSSFFPVFGGKL